MLLIYITRPMARLIIRMGAVPGAAILFHHVRALERLDDELEKDLAEWIRGSLLLLLITANMEVLLWHKLIPYPDLLDKHKWFGVGLRIMLAIAVMQTDARPGAVHASFIPVREFPKFPPAPRSRINCGLLRSRWASAFLAAPQPIFARVRDPGRNLHRLDRLDLLWNGRAAILVYRSGHVARPGDRRAAWSLTNKWPPAATNLCGK